MRELVGALLKLNLIGGALLVGYALWVGASLRPSSGQIVGFGAGLVLLGFLNVRTVFLARRAVAESLRDGATEMAASALDLRDAARARVEKRRAERKQQADR